MFDYPYPRLQIRCLREYHEMSVTQLIGSTTSDSQPGSYGCSGVKRAADCLSMPHGGLPVTRDISCPISNIPFSVKKPDHGILMSLIHTRT